MKIHLYKLADPNNPDEACSVGDCKNQASHWWPLWDPPTALCQFHYDFPPKGKLADLVSASQEPPDDFDYSY